MSSQQLKRWIQALLVLSVFALAGCGGDDNEDVVQGGGGGQTNPGPVQGGCIPINQQFIGFSGSQVYIDRIKITGGQIPYGGGAGYGNPGYNNGGINQMVIGGGATQGRLQGSGVDGNISMDVQFLNPQQPNLNTGGFNNNYSQGQYASVTGSISISPATQQDIYYQSGAGFGYGNGGFGYGGYNNGGFNNGFPNNGFPNGQQICVSGIAIDLVHHGNLANGGYDTITGNVYLYLNNTQHGYILTF